MTANVNRDSKKHPSPYKPSDFDPFELERRRKIPKMYISMKQAFNLISKGSKL